MDGGPFRMPQPADRRIASRPEATRRQEEFQPVPEPQNIAPQQPATSPVSKKRKTTKRFPLPLVVVAIVLIVGLGGWLLWSKMSTGGVAIDKSKYQAVFFTNGQVYFGKLQPMNNEYVKLTDIYYLQTQNSGQAGSENPQQTSTDQSNVQLIKLGDEIHGPEDQMIISKDQILFYENLKADGKVAQSIQKYKAP